MFIGARATVEQGLDSLRVSLGSRNDECIFLRTEELGFDRRARADKYLDCVCVPVNSCCHKCCTARRVRVVHAVPPYTRGFSSYGDDVVNSE